MAFYIRSLLKSTKIKPALFVTNLTKMPSSNGVNNIEIVLTQAKTAKFLDHWPVWKARIWDQRYMGFKTIKKFIIAYQIIKIVRR